MGGGGCGSNHKHGVPQRMPNAGLSLEPFSSIKITLMSDQS